jgi:hypothetical protein
MASLPGPYLSILLGVAAVLWEASRPTKLFLPGAGGLAAILAGGYLVVARNPKLSEPQTTTLWLCSSALVLAVSCLTAVGLRARHNKRSDL